MLAGGWVLTKMGGALLAVTATEDIANDFYAFSFQEAYVYAVVSMALGAGPIGFGAMRANKELYRRRSSSPD